MSFATNLVAGDTNGYPDVFVYDRQSGTTERVSVAIGGTQGDQGSSQPSISADGRFIAFQSEASNLVAGDTNNRKDVFVHDRQSGTTERVSIATGGAQGNDESFSSSISSDGRYVAFVSDASDLVAGDTNGATDVFVHDRVIGTTERVSVATGGAEGNSASNDSSISTDGRYVAFASGASNLVAGDTSARVDVFFRCREGIGTKYCAANANSSGAPADLLAAGSASSGSGDLIVTSMPVPNQNGIFFHGMNQTQIPFGNGFLCATGDIVRGTVVQSTGNVATYTYDNSDTKHSLAAFVGITRNFQHWFRDPMGGGALYNTSNAISIAILP